MDESTQQLLALGLVALVIIAELLRRQRKRRKSNSGCDGCDSSAKTDAKKTQPLKFYRRR